MTSKLLLNGEILKAPSLREVMTQECSLSLFLFSIVLKILASAIIPWNKKYIGWKGRKQSLFAKRHDCCIEYPKYMQINY